MEKIVLLAALISAILAMAQFPDWLRISLIMSGDFRRS